MESGNDLDALNYIRLCWGLMLEHGATSCWEMWDRNTSLCHGWSAAPAMILPAYVLGVRPTRPGFREFLVEPRPGDLQWAEGKVPTPHGTIRVAWKIEGENGDIFRLSIVVPEHTEAKFRPPKEFTSADASVDGIPVGNSSRGIILANGRHQIELRGTASTTDAASTEVSSRLPTIGATSSRP